MEPTPESDGAGPASQPQALEQARSKRLALGDAMDKIEHLIARPAGHPAWTDDVEASLGELADAFGDHVDEVEGDDGILTHLLDDEPRLANHIKRMYTEHVDIQSAIETTTTLVHGCGGDCGQEVIEAVRVATVDVLRMISRHRQAGADLVYEAYSVDIGGG